MIGPYDLAAIVVMCVTAIVMAVIRSSYVTAIEDVAEDVDEVRKVPEAMANLRETVIANGLFAERLKLEVDRLKAEKTREALGGRK